TGAAVRELVDRALRGHRVRRGAPVRALLRRTDARAHIRRRVPAVPQQRAGMGSPHTAVERTRLTRADSLRILSPSKVVWLNGPGIRHATAHGEVRNPLDDVLSLEGSALDAKHYSDDCAENQPADAHDLRQLARAEQRVAQDRDAEERGDPVHEDLLALLTKA